MSRQEAHEEVRVLSQQASHVVKVLGGKNDFSERIKKTKYFEPIWSEIDGMLDPLKFIGRCPEQMDRNCGPGREVERALKPYKTYIDASVAVELSV